MMHSGLSTHTITASIALIADRSQAFRLLSISLLINTVRIATQECMGESTNEISKI